MIERKRIHSQIYPPTTLAVQNKSMFKNARFLNISDLSTPHQVH